MSRLLITIQRYDKASICLDFFIKFSQGVDKTGQLMLYIDYHEGPIKGLCVVNKSILLDDTFPPFYLSYGLNSIFDYCIH
jgi:hypothetical protein